MSTKDASSKMAIRNYTCTMQQDSGNLRAHTVTAPQFDNIM